MLASLVTEAVEQLPGSSSSHYDEPLASGQLGSPRAQPWSVAAVHQGDARHAARTLYTLAPSVPLAYAGVHTALAVDADVCCGHCPPAVLVYALLSMLSMLCT